MAAITEDEIRRLASFHGEDAPVTTCYLDVDGSRHVRHQDVVRHTETLLRSARLRANGHPSVSEDLERIAEHVRAGLDRSRTRGLALFSCSAHDLWHVVALPVRVRSQVVFNHTPYVRPLETVVDEYEPFGVLLVDRQRARMVVFETGEAVASTEVFEPLPRDDDDDHSYTRDKARDHVEAQAQRHLKAAASLAFDAFQERAFDRLILGVADDIAPGLEAALHPYLQSRIEARCPVSPNASDEEIRRAALAVEATVERRKEAEAVARLRQAVGAGAKGVAGAADTLRALVERRVDTLLVAEGYAEPGWRCGGCSWMGLVGRACPVCDSEMGAVEDVVEEAIEEALAQSCRLEVCVGNADLDVLGRIGALLRF